MRRIVLMLGLVALVGCASSVGHNFYGVRIDYERFDDDFKIFAAEGRMSSIRVVNMFIRMSPREVS